MSTKIQWTEATWNPVVGCSPVSEGCRNCYAAREAVRLAGNLNPKVSAPYEGTSEMRGTGAQRRAVFTGRVNTLPERLDRPLRWRKPRRVFVNSMSDLFHEDVPLDFVDRVFGVMAASPHHTFQVLTKRPERMAEYLRGVGLGRSTVDEGVQLRRARVQREVDRIIDTCGRPTRKDAAADPWPLPNVWLGTSVEDQAAADERIPHLLRTPAAVRFLSCEPLLGPVDLTWWMGALDREAAGVVRDPLAASLLQRGMDEGLASAPTLGERLHWIIAGGESGPATRPCDVAWIRGLVELGYHAGIPVFTKQLGARPVDRNDRFDAHETGDPQGWPDGADLEDAYEPRYQGEKARIVLRDRKGGDPSEWPADLRVREFPEVAR